MTFVCRRSSRRRRRESSAIITRNKQPEDNTDHGRGNPGYLGTPRSSVGDVSKKGALDPTWMHPDKQLSGFSGDVIPHDFMKRIATGEKSSPRQVQHYHYEPGNKPDMASNILTPASTIHQPGFNQPGFPHEPIMDPIFADIAQPTRSSNPFPHEDSFDSPYTKPVSGSPSMISGNAHSDSGYMGSDGHYNRRPSYQDENESDISHDDPSQDISHGTDAEQTREVSPDHGLPDSRYPVRGNTPDLVKQMPLKVYDIPEEQSLEQEKHTPIPIKEYPDNPSPVDESHKQSPLPLKEYPDTQSPVPLKEYPESPIPTEFPSRPEQVKHHKNKPLRQYTPSPVEVVGRDTPDVIQHLTEEPNQFRPIRPETQSPCASPVDSLSGFRTPTPMGRSPYPGMRSPIPQLGDDQPYYLPSPWKIPYIYKKEALMYIDDTDTESVISSMSTRDLYVRSHKECNNPRVPTPMMREPYRPSYARMPPQYRPETITETDV